MFTTPNANLLVKFDMPFEIIDKNVFFFSISKTLIRPSLQLFNYIFKILNCSPFLQTIFTLALTHSKNPDFALVAETHLNNCLPALVQSYVQQGNF